jgi:uncharacterized protein with von Willebrand factor type A (vWA) domain
VPFSVAESIDALRAASAVEAERETLREALAAAVVKDEADRPVFDEVFDRFFSVDLGEASRRRKRPGGLGGDGAAGRGDAEAGRSAPRRSDGPRERPMGFLPPRSEEPRLPEPGRREVQRRRSLRALLRKPFRQLDPLEAEAVVALAEELARRFWARRRRRLRAGRTGRLDVRRTLRRSIGHGGAAFHLDLRRPRPGRVDLVALCDVSGSVRCATEFFAALLAPSADFFRRVRLFLFVDRPVEASVEAGRLVPHEPLDLHARSDFGRVLVELERLSLPIGRSTVVVVLGDARNNRRPPRADLLARLRSRARALWWLNPDPASRWGQGDSVVAAYRPHCDVLLEASTPEALVRALARLAGRRRGMW